LPAARNRISPERARAELERRAAAAIASMTAAAVAGGHRIQEAILTGTWAALVLMCSRRAGKSIVCVALCILTALKTASVNCLYLSLTKEQSAPRFEEAKAMLDRFKIPYTPFEGDQLIVFGNGSQIRFTGIDDKRRAAVFKGDQLASGIVIVDEAQDDPGLLEWLLKEVLDPMVSETTAEKPEPGRIVVAGVVPETEAGYFWQLWTENYDDEAAAPRPDAAWLCMAWGRVDNPHERDFEKHLAAYCKKYKLDRDDPIVLRNWRGLRVFDRNVTAYRYNEQRDAWTGVPAPWLSEFKAPLDARQRALGTLRACLPPPGVNTFGIGIDPASRRDCCTLVVNGWGTVGPDVYQVAEFVSEPGSGIRQDQWIEVMRFLRERYGNVVRQLRDAGSAAEDIFLADYKVLIEAVKKYPGSVKDRVDRTASLLGRGLYHVLAGSQLETQLKTVRWSPKAREKGQWVLLPTIPNDVSDAGDYGLVPYFDATEPKKEQETYAEMHERLMRESFNPPVPYGYEDDPALVQLLGE
jgi:hypothetical protein